MVTSQCLKFVSKKRIHNFISEEECYCLDRRYYFIGTYLIFLFFINNPIRYNLCNTVICNTHKYRYPRVSVVVYNMLYSVSKFPSQVCKVILTVASSYSYA